MRHLRLEVLILGTLVAPLSHAAEPDAKWEEQARKALTDGDRQSLQQLAAEYRKLAPEVRAALPVRIRADSVEFAFRGAFCGDQFEAQMLEYLVSAPGKDYESLLVVTGAEEERVQALRSIFDQRARNGRGKTWTARLTWSDGEQPQSVELADLLISLDAAERTEFLDQLAVNSAGLGGSKNVKSVPGVLPKKRVPARLYLTVRMVPKKD
ncbi:MAG TPA: hypothetical protein VKD71_09380 [Gemmataceae bacterium]|nr:hypothetical protein [Gemmataceae bacterium]